VFLKKGFEGAKSIKHNEGDVGLRHFEHKKLSSLYCGFKKALSATETS